MRRIKINYSSSPYGDQKSYAAALKCFVDAYDKGNIATLILDKTYPGHSETESNYYKTFDNRQTQFIQSSDIKEKKVLISSKSFNGINYFTSYGNNQSCMYISENETSYDLMRCDINSRVDGFGKSIINPSESTN